jgi:LPS export ABC transporter permease LptG/LPS export ABC transporter permease LptF
MGLIGRTLFIEILSSALLGSVLFVFVLFLQKAAGLFSILVNASTTPANVGYLFLLLLPATLPLTIPLGVLSGTLIALSRMSSDGEIIALRASGVPARRLALPTAVFGLAAVLLTGVCSLWLTPWCNTETIRVLNDLGAAQVTAEIQPRVFEESFPNTILYVGDVLPGQPVRWRNIFIADMTPPGKRKSMGAGEQGEGPRVTLAGEAIVTPDPARNRLQMSMVRNSTYEAGPNPETYYRVSYPKGEQVLDARERSAVRAKLFSATPTLELLPEIKKSAEANIEFHQRLALPLACLLLALTGLPLGVSSRKGGKSAAFVVTVAVAFLYYMALVSLVGLAREGRINPTLAVWLPDLLFAVLGIVALIRLERTAGRDLFGTVKSWAALHTGRIASTLQRATARPGSYRRFTAMPLVIDSLVLSSFLFYFAVLLASFVMLTEVFNFFELLGDVFKQQIPMPELIRYLVFLAPKLIFDAAPVSILVAVLVTFGVMAKNNEITAFKACGVSLYRLATPVLIASALISAALFAFDHYVATQANLVQDALRNRIKNKPVQTYLSPGRQWIFGRGSRIYYYKLFDPEHDMLGEVSVFEFDDAAFRLKRHIRASQARWEPRLKTWVFQDGWARDLQARDDRFLSFAGETATFASLDEPPAWFAKEVKTYKQMTFEQLNSYIAELRQSGFSVVPLEVQYNRKFSLPLFAFVMALISVPFAFLTGSRGAMTGAGVSLFIAIAYFSLNFLFEQLGNVGLMPPALAAWSPHAVFTLSGAYLLTRLKT